MSARLCGMGSLFQTGARLRRAPDRPDDRREPTRGAGSLRGARDRRDQRPRRGRGEGPRGREALEEGGRVRHDLVVGAADCVDRGHSALVVDLRWSGTDRLDRSADVPCPGPLYPATRIGSGPAPGHPGVGSGSPCERSCAATGLSTMEPWTPKPPRRPRRRAPISRNASPPRTSQVVRHRRAGPRRGRAEGHRPRASKPSTSPAWSRSSACS